MKNQSRKRWTHSHAIAISDVYPSEFPSDAALYRVVPGRRGSLTGGETIAVNARQRSWSKYREYSFEERCPCF
jgi:hypothetical protein